MKLTKEQKQQRAVARSIKAANAAYKKATPSQRRVMIAKDVIKMLNAKAIAARSMSFVDNIDIPNEMSVSDTMQFQELIHKHKKESQPTPACSVCGVGALFVSAVGYRNQCLIDGYGEFATTNYNEPALDGLKEFSSSQKILVELAFEAGSGYYSTGSGIGIDVLRSKLNLAAEGWAHNHGLDSGSKECLIAIMNNIINHGGRFNPLVK